MTILATLVVLGVLIFVHELGHFGAAKLVGIEVQRFSIGLGPRILGFTRGETEYVISAIPLGGYVKMGGMGDEVMEQIEGGPSSEPREPSPRDFDAKPVWARAFVISAGVIMNMVLAFGIYAFVAGWWGTQQVGTTRVGEVRAELLPAGTAALATIPVGAVITQLDGAPVAHWGEVGERLLDGPAGPLVIETSDPVQRIEIDLPVERDARLQLVGAVGYWVDARVGALNPGSPAEQGGVEAGDRIVAVDGEPVVNWYDFVRRIQARPDRRIALTLERDGGRIVRNVESQTTSVTDPVSGESLEVGAIGVFMPIDDVIYERAGPVEAVVHGWRETVVVTGTIVDFLRRLVTGDLSPRSMGSIVTIGQASGQAAAMGLDNFLRFMGLFSVNLAVLNLLPIPVLDGGHLVFLAIEAIRGRPVSVEQRVRWSNVGFVILVLIMLLALFNDVLRLFGM